MDIEYATEDLKKLATEANETGGLAQAVVKKYRQRILLIKSAPDERDFFALKSLHFEKLKGHREGQRSMRLNDQWRLILEIDESQPKKIVRIIGIEDYH